MTLVIAEAGVNHNGSEKLAFDLVDAAHEAGADIVKFQTFTATELASHSATQAEYQERNTRKEESQLSMLERLELSRDVHSRLVEYCDSLGIEFLSTAFDPKSFRFLVEELKLKRLKIASGELTNAPFVLDHARSGLPLIVSTGMASLAEIESALGVIAFGYTASLASTPTVSAFQKAYASTKGREALRDRVTLLHCTTEYPAAIEEINLKVMDTIGSAFGLSVGYSDHSEGIVVPIAAAARGATTIEKHFTLDRGLEGPDHLASLEPDELKAMVKAIGQTCSALGDAVKAPTESEIKNKSVARKSLVASKVIKIGEVFTPDNVAIKRPGSGLSPYNFWSLMNVASKRDYALGDLISE